MKKYLKLLSILLLLFCSIAAADVKAQADQMQTEPEKTEPEYPGSEIPGLENPEPGRMEICLMCEHKPLQGQRVTLYRVADLDMKEKPFSVCDRYRKEVPDSELKDLDIAANNEAESVKMLGIVTEMNVEPDFSGTTSQDGVCSFSEMEAGLYLIRVEDTEQTKSTPALISVPQYISSAGEWSSDIRVEPKIIGYTPTVTPEPTPTVTTTVTPEPTPTVTPTVTPTPAVTPGPNGKPVPVKTGDYSSTGIHLVIFLLAAGTILVLIFAKYRNRKKTK